MENKLITIYSTSEFMGNVTKTEAKLIECGIRKYAQYDKAPFVAFIPKGKRKGFQYIKGYQPYLLVIEGHNHPDPDSMFKAPIVTDTVTVRESKYLSFDDRYKTDFDSNIDAYLEDKKDIVLMDCRHTKNTLIVK